MYSMEFSNSCNITHPHPDAVSQGSRQIYRGDFLVIKGRDDSVTKCSLSKRLQGRHLRMWGSSRLKNGATKSVASISSEDSADMEDLNSDSKESVSRLYFGKATDKEEIAALRESAIRTNLMKKLSDANVYGRHIQRQLREKEDALRKCKSELATMETEMEALVSLAQEVASEGAKPGTRQINGKYIQSHLAIRLEELYGRLLLRVKDIEEVCFRNVLFVWYGMAEDVQVMGSFDGWTQGVQLSPEMTGSFMKFSATAKLRPGRYQIKFLVDGMWQVSPDLPSVGEGLTVNNLLVVE